METHFQQELAKLKEQLLKMGGLAERAISNAIDALVKRDTPLAEKTIGEDEKINKMELLIDEWCLKLHALHQPLAADLRFLGHEHLLAELAHAFGEGFRTELLVGLGHALEVDLRALARLVSRPTYPYFFTKALKRARELRRKCT